MVEIITVILVGLFAFGLGLVVGVTETTRTRKEASEETAQLFIAVLDEMEKALGPEIWQTIKEKIEQKKIEQSGVTDK